MSSASRAFGPPGAGTLAPTIDAWPTRACWWSMWVDVEAPASLPPAPASFASGTAATGIAAPARSFRLLRRLDMPKLYIR